MKKMLVSLQKLGKALMLPVACLPVCGILMGLGYALAPGAMGVPDAPTSGFMYCLGFFLIKAGGALIDNMALLFAIGVAVGLAKDNDGTAGLSGLVSWLMITNLLSPGVVSVIFPKMVESQTNAVAFSKIANPFIGILCGIIGAVCYNKFRNTKLPDVLAFFSGKRAVAIVTGLVSIVVAAILLFVWPILFGVLVSAGNGIKGLGVVGVGLYAFLNRLLIPTGLHHALNNVFWFDTIGLGDLTAYWGALVEGDTMANGTVINWSVGSYMAGFFPCMMFGIAGAALAMILTAKSSKRKATIGIVGSAAICALLCGVTEPFEFAFMFLAFPLYVVYSLLYGIFAAVTVGLGFRAGFCFSAGLTDLIFSAFLPAANKTWLIIPMGLLAFAVFFAVFYFAIKKWDIKTPGREDDEEETAQIASISSDKDLADLAKAYVDLIGGKENVDEIQACITRIRLVLKDNSSIEEKDVKKLGASGLMKAGNQVTQIIVGTKAELIVDEMKKYLA